MYIAKILYICNLNIAIEWRVNQLKRKIISLQK